MDNTKKTVQSQNISLLVLIGCVILLFIMNLLFLFLANQRVKSIALLKEQLNIYLNDQKIISAASSLSDQYKSEIETISAVFPNEETISVFINDLENLIKSQSAEYSIKFNAIQPTPEEDRLFLPVTITMKIKLNQLIEFLESLEKWPYLTHVTIVSINSPQGLSGILETKLTFKIYVKKPFTAQ